MILMAMMVVILRLQFTHSETCNFFFWFLLKETSSATTMSRVLSLARLHRCQVCSATYCLPSEHLVPPEFRLVVAITTPVTCHHRRPPLAYGVPVPVLYLPLPRVEIAVFV